MRCCCTLSHLYVVHSKICELLLFPMLMENVEFNNSVFYVTYSVLVNLIIIHKTHYFVTALFLTFGFLWLTKVSNPVYILCVDEFFHIAGSCTLSNEANERISWKYIKSFKTLVYLLQNDKIINGLNLNSVVFYKMTGSGLCLADHL